MEEEDGATEPESESDLEDVSSADCASLWSRLPLRLRKAFGLGDDPVANVLANFFADAADLVSFTTAHCPSGTNLRQTQHVVRILVARASVQANRGHKRRTLVPDSAKHLAVAISSVAKRSCTGDAVQNFSVEWLRKRSGAIRRRRWCHRLAKRLALATGSTSRQEIEKQELQRWQSELATLVTEASLPVVEHMELVRFPESMLLAALGSARASTVRKHVREWRKVRLYCLSATGLVWPQHVGVLLDYLYERRVEPCARTVPQAILVCLSFMEKAGGVRPEERFSTLPTLRNTVNQLTADLEAKAPPTRKAPMLPVSLIGAIELAVSDTSLPLYARAFAFYKLVKFWTASRSGDLTGLAPASLRMTEHGLSGLLDRTKTSGPGKRVRFLPIFISKRVYFMNAEWLSTGWSIWTSEAIWFERDYFLPLPNADASAAIHRMSDYASTMSFSKRLLKHLKQPVWDGVCWRQSDKNLFVEVDTLAFWTEHSERNWLVSVLTSLGVPSEQRDFVGRWRVVTASDEYVRTAQHAVITLQEEALEGVRKDTRWNLVNGGLDDLAVFLKDRGVDCAASSAQLALLQLDPDAGVRLGAELAGRGDGCLAARQLAPVVFGERSLEVTAVAELCEEADNPPFYIAVVGKRRLRRLHRRGGCGTDPDDLHEMVPVYELQEAEYDVACKHCWRNGKQPHNPTPEASADASGSGEEDESSSSESEAS